MTTHTVKNGLNEDWMMTIFADEMKKIDRVHDTSAIEKQRLQNTYFQKWSCGVRCSVYWPQQRTPWLQRWQDNVFETPIHLQQTPQQQHTHTSPWHWWNSYSWNHQPWSDDWWQSSSGSLWTQHLSEKVTLSLKPQNQHIRGQPLSSTAYISRVLCSCVNTPQACMHPCAHRSIFFNTQALLSWKRKLCHRHVDYLIHMHFHDNPTDTYHHSVHAHEESLGTTPRRTPSDPARSTFGYQAELPPSTVIVHVFSLFWNFPSFAKHLFCVSFWWKNFITCNSKVLSDITLLLVLATASSCTSTTIRQPLTTSVDILP